MLVGQKGSHVKISGIPTIGSNKVTIIVPYHKTLKLGTLAGILKITKTSASDLK